MERLSLDEGPSKKKTYTSEIGGEGGAGDEKPLYEGSRVVSLNRERDSFADVRRKRVDEYGKEIRGEKEETWRGERQGGGGVSFESV